MHKSAWNGAAKLLFVAVMAALLLTGCARTMASGDAGCGSYGEARLTMPDADIVPLGKWGDWIADLDDRMTGTCR